MARQNLRHPNNGNIDRKLCNHCDFSDKSVKDGEGIHPCMFKLMNQDKNACRFNK